MSEATDGRESGPSWARVIVTISALSALACLSTAKGVPDHAPREDVPARPKKRRLAPRLLMAPLIGIVSAMLAVSLCLRWMGDPAREARPDDMFFATLAQVNGALVVALVIEARNAAPARAGTLTLAASSIALAVIASFLGLGFDAKEDRQAAIAFAALAMIATGIALGELLEIAERAWRHDEEDTGGRGNGPPSGGQAP